MGDVIDAAEQALGIVALHGDRCAAALVRELERLQRIEAAAIATRDADNDYSAAEAGSDAERTAARRLIEARLALYRTLGEQR